MQCDKGASNSLDSCVLETSWKKKWEVLDPVRIQCSHQLQKTGPPAANGVAPNFEARELPLGIRLLSLDIPIHLQ